MQRGAREANAESHAIGQSRDLGAAIGGLTAFVVAINKLTERVESLEQQVKELNAATGSTKP